MIHPSSASRHARRSAAWLLVLAIAGPCLAQANNSAGVIYSCVDAAGHKITRDRPIAECSDRDQRVLNGDGSLRQTLPPTRTQEETVLIEEQLRAREAAKAAERDAIRRDRNLLIRFPTEAAHRKAREAALENLRKAVLTSEQRLAVLAKERKPLTSETEFYVGKPLPLKLKLALDANDASVDAQKNLMQNQQLEIVRIDKGYDEELEHLRKLWNGARPGTLGPLAAASAPSATSQRR